MNASRRLWLALLLLAAACGINHEHYDTARQARAFGVADRGFPSCVPDTATNIDMVTDHNNGRIWVWCILDHQAQSELAGKVRKVGWNEAAANAMTPPFTTFQPDWNPILGGTLTYTPPAGPLYFVFGDWHGIAEPDGRCWITLTTARKHA